MLPTLRYAKERGRWSSMRQLGQHEAVIMERLWSDGRAVPVREVLEDLQRNRTIAYTSAWR
jgi:predicted transcriptional regulator